MDRHILSGLYLFLDIIYIYIYIYWKYLKVDLPSFNNDAIIYGFETVHRILDWPS